LRIVETVSISCIFIRSSGSSAAELWSGSVVAIAGQGYIGVTDNDFASLFELVSKSACL